MRSAEVSLLVCASFLNIDDYADAFLAAPVLEKTWVMARHQCRRRQYCEVLEYLLGGVLATGAVEEPLAILGSSI
jgi:hypothetical protein